jgi:hypothetical protein
MNNAYLFHGLQGSLPVFELLVSKLRPDQLDVPTHPDRFTPREVVAHLADWEPILLERMKTAKSNPGAPIPAYDEGEMAIQNRYSEKDVQAQLSAFKKLRGETIGFLRSLSKEDWEKHYRHPEQGLKSIEDLSAMMVGHDQYHLDQLSEVVAR